ASNDNVITASMSDGRQVTKLAQRAHPAISNDVAHCHPRKALRRAQRLASSRGISRRSSISQGRWRPLDYAAIIGQRKEDRRWPRGVATSLPAQDCEPIFDSCGRSQHNTAFRPDRKQEKLTHDERGAAVAPGMPVGQGTVATRRRRVYLHEMRT